MAEASTTSSHRASVVPPDTIVAEQEFQEPLNIDTDVTDDTGNSDALSSAVEGNVVDLTEPKDMTEEEDIVEEEDDAPPFPPINIFSMPNARMPFEAFSEMTLACRFVPTDQWLTTRVDRSWTVSQVKHHMLTKFWGGRRYQLNLPRPISPPKRDGLEGMEARGRTSISSSNYSSVIFNWNTSSNAGDQDPPYFGNASVQSLVQTIPPDSPEGGLTPRLTRSLSTENLNSRGRSPSSTSSRRGLSVGARRRPIHSDTASDIRREEVIEKLYERIEASARKKVVKAAKNYRLVSFSNGNILDDKATLGSYGIKPFELLEIHPAARCIRLSRRNYLEPYFESDIAVRLRAGAEKHGLEFLKRLRQIQQEERAKAELAKAMAALGLEEMNNRPGNEWGTGLSAVLRRKNLEERKEEEKRRILLEQARREEEKKAKRERKEAESEKWKLRKLIVEGNDLNIWKDPLHDTFPEQSWDLRRVIDVQIPRPQPSILPSTTPSTYTALAISSRLQSVSTRAPQKKVQKAEATQKTLELPTLHIRFSIPLATVHASLNPAGAAALHAARLKRAAKQNPDSAYLAESLASLGAASTRRLDSTDPYNQGIGFGTSTLEGAGSATLVLRLPNERTREHLCRIIHRCAGKYPLIHKPRRKLAFEPVADLIPLPDPDPEKTRSHSAQFPDWRTRVLKKSIASGRAGFLSSTAWSAEFNPDTGLYMRPVSSKGEGESEYEADDDDDGKSLESDTEWEGWRRDLEADVFPKPGITNSNSLSPSAFQAHHHLPLPAWKEESASVLRSNASIIIPENIPAADEETRLLVPVAKSQHSRTRRGSLYAAKQTVVEGIAGKGLVIPRTKAYRSWASLSSASSINSSFQSHEEYRAGEGSDTNAYKKPPLSVIIDQRRASGSILGTRGLGRARSATVASARANVTVPLASTSAPLSATNTTPSTSTSSSSGLGVNAGADPKINDEGTAPVDFANPWVQDPVVREDVFDDMHQFGEDVLLPGLGGGLGNPALFPRYADMSTTVTTITGGRQASGSGSGSGSLKKKMSGKRSMGSLRGLVKSFSKSGENREGNNTTSQDSVSRQSSTSGTGVMGRRVSQRER